MNAMLEPIASRLNRGVLLKNETTSIVSSGSRLHLEPLCVSELETFAQLVREHVSIYYPETEPTYPYTLASTTYPACPDVFGLWRGRRQVWSVVSRKRSVGYFVATEKSDRRVKIGPIVIAPECRGRGYGEYAIEALARHYCGLGFWKLYMTVPACNTAARCLALSTGFLLEATLARHYSPEWDEFVFGRLLRSRDLRWLDHRVERVKPLAKANYLHGCQQATLRHHLELQSQSNVNDYAKTPHRSYVAYNGETIKTLLVTAPKRGGAVKLSFIGDDTAANVDLLRAAEGTYRQLGKRKLYSIVPMSSGARIQLLAREGFVAEGQFSDRRGFMQTLLVKLWKL